MVRIWLEKLEKQIGVAFRYTERLHGVLVKRVSYLKMKMKNLRGGAPRQKFFQQDWQLNVNQDEVEVHAMSRKIGTLEQELVATKEQNADMSAQVRQMQSQKATLEAKLYDMSAKLKTGKHAGRGRSCNKSFENYSESHKRRLKRARTQSCQDSLLWLHREGYIPLTVEVKNTQTGEMRKSTFAVKSLASCLDQKR